MSDTRPKPGRRYLRFGLRAMFVGLTLATLLMGWRAKFSRDRRDARLTCGKKGASFVSGAQVEGLNAIPPAPTISRIPFLALIFGNDLAVSINIPHDFPASEEKRLNALFPEANAVYRLDRNGEVMPP